MFYCRLEFTKWFFFQILAHCVLSTYRLVLHINFFSSKYKQDTSYNLLWWATIFSYIIFITFLVCIHAFNFCVYVKSNMYFLIYHFYRNNGGRRWSNALRRQLQMWWRGWSGLSRILGRSEFRNHQFWQFWHFHDHSLPMCNPWGLDWCALLGKNEINREPVLN